MIPLYIILTAFTAQFIYIVVNWYYFRRSEYFYYSIYIIVFSLYLLNRYLGDETGMIRLGWFSLNKMYSDRVLCLLSYIYYFKFGRRFVEAQTRYPGIHQMMTLTEKLLLSYIGIEIILLLTTGYSHFENLLFIPVNVSIFLVLAYVFWTMLKKREALDKFILTGSMFYGISAVATLILGLGKSPLENDHMLPLQIGALVEMAFLNAGLVYKSRMLQQETIKSKDQLIRQFEENQSLTNRLNSIRENISRDLHDDVGATLSSIKAYSEILKMNPQSPAIAELIGESSSEMIERLEMIAWSANPEHDHGKSLLIRLQQFAAPLCHAHHVHLQIDSIRFNEQIPLPGEIRQHVFLLFKETVNNMIKYAEAKNCQVSISLDENHFDMQVSDDGEGFDTQKPSSGNGLKNIQRRIDLLGGLFLLTSVPNQGTSISIRIPLTSHGVV